MNITAEQFAQLTPGTRVPIYTEVLADLETPVSAYLKVTQGSPMNFLLESVEGGERWARYSFIGVGAKGSITAFGHQVKLEGSFGNQEFDSSDPLKVLYEKIVTRVEPDPVLPALFGGAVGYSSYDLVRCYEKLPSKNPDELGIPDLKFIEPEGMVIFDHLKHRLFIVSTAETGMTSSYNSAKAVVEKLHSRLKGALPGVPGIARVARQNLPATSRKQNLKPVFPKPSNTFGQAIFSSRAKPEVLGATSRTPVRRLPRIAQRQPQPLHGLPRAGRLHPGGCQPRKPVSQ